MSISGAPDRLSSVRVGNPTRSSEEGPLRGVVQLIETQDLNEAIQVTTKIAMARRMGFGGRPIQGAQAMKFLFMIFHDEGVLDALPKGEMQTLVDSALDYDEEIRQSGHYIVSNALQRARSARTIRVRGGNTTITDGPFAETKEQLGGFFLIEAKDMDEACAVAARFPPARIGTIEVRPVQELEHS